MKHNISYETLTLLVATIGIGETLRQDAAGAIASCAMRGWERSVCVLLTGNDL